MIYEVTAVSVDPNYPNTFSPSRTEVIDTATNELFHGCYGEWDVEDTYTRFWNRLNPSWEHGFPSGKEKVLVISVEEVGVS